MKILKLLNKKYLSIIIIYLLLGYNSHSEEEPVDIWNIDIEKKDKSSISTTSIIEGDDDSDKIETNIYDMQSQKKKELVEMNEILKTKESEIIGLYDPEDYSLKIDMWSNSNGDQLKYLFSNLAKLDLSEDAADLMNISMLTNAHYPETNITKEEFLSIRSNWLIKNKDFNLIEEYLAKNQVINLHPNLSKYLINHYLSESNIIKACEIFKENNKPVKDEYLSMFNLYCLVNDGKNEDAQLILDLKKELGFQNDYFEQKLNFLFGYSDQVDNAISEKSILEFHLAHRTNPEFTFEPKKNTNKLIWKYLATSNLLYDIDEIEITDLNKISLIEKATSDKNYPEDDLFELYKKFQFNINQLLNAVDAHKTLTNIEARALVYQRILLESEENKKLELIKILKDLFIKDDFSNAFDKKLKKFLENIDPEKIPSNFTTFYNLYQKNETESEKRIKFNNDILHQSKLINYFNGDYAKSKIEKDINNFLKKIKKNKKYFISKKDIIFIESLRSDGVKISKKYDDLYQLNETEIPTDIQIMINNNEMGAVVLRIIEVVGQDTLDILDEDTLYFIIHALNQLNIDYVRNKILLKVLPLKV